MGTQKNRLNEHVLELMDKSEFQFCAQKLCLCKPNFTYAAQAVLKTSMLTCAEEQ